MNRKLAVLYVLASLLYSIPSAAQTCGYSPAPQTAEHIYLQQIKILSATIFGLAVNPSDSCALYNPCSSGGPPCGCAANDPSCQCPALYNGSPNHKLLARTWYYGWALRNSSGAGASHLACARTELKSILDAQETWGHYSTSGADEALTTTHFQLYAGAMAADYLFALTSTKNWAQRTPDTVQDIMVRSRRWWLDENKLWGFLANSGQIDAPGGRFPVAGPGQTPCTDLNPPCTNMAYRNIVYAQLQGQQPALPGGWNDKYYTGGWILDELRKRGLPASQSVLAPLSGYTPIVRLHDTLCIYRQHADCVYHPGADYLFYFPRMSKVSNPVFWVQSEFGSHSASPPVGGVPVWPATSPGPFTGFLCHGDETLGRPSASPLTCPEPWAIP